MVTKLEYTMFLKLQFQMMKKTTDFFRARVFFVIDKVPDSNLILYSAGFRKKENENKGYGQTLPFLDEYLKESKPITP